MEHVSIKVGFIGCGNMARAIIKGILTARILSNNDLSASSIHEESKKYIRDILRIRCASNREIASSSDVLFLALKPQVYEEVIEEIRGNVKKGSVIVTMAPGKTLSWLNERFGIGSKIIRTMPNTPALVGEGMTGVCANENVSERDLETVLKLLQSFGRAEVVPEKLMDTVTAVSGSSPAYVFMFIEAMADGAVAEGMPREQAYRFAAQSILGSAKMVLDTGLHPAILKDKVCSPGGTTIIAVKILEEKGLRSAIIEAEIACAAKSRQM